MLIVCTCIKNVMGILFGPLAFFLFRRLMLSLTLESEMLIFLIEVSGNGPFSRMLFLSSLVNMDASCYLICLLFLWCFCYLPFSFTVCPLLCIITCSCYDHVMIVIHINILYSLKAVDCLLFLPCFKTCLYIRFFLAYHLLYLPCHPRYKAFFFTVFLGIHVSDPDVLVMNWLDPAETVWYWHKFVTVWL